MPTIRKRFLFQVLLTFMVVVGLIVGIHTIQAGRIPDALHRQADRALAENQPDSGIRYLRQYLEFRPDDVDVQEKLAGLLRARAGEQARSELVFLYDKILRADPTRQAVRREAIIACLQLHRFTDAATHAEALLSDQPRDATIWRYLAKAQAGQRQFEEATKSYEQAIELAPNELLGYQLYAEYLWLDRDQPNEARRVYDRMVAALPDNAEGYVHRAKFLMRPTESSGAIPVRKDDPVLRDLDRALSLDPTLADAALFKGERLQRHRDILGARAAFLDGRKHNPENEDLARSLAWLEVHRGNIPGAIQVLEEAATLSEDGLNIIVPLADLLLQTGDQTRIREIIESLQQHKGDVVKNRANYLRGRLAMEQQRWQEAIDIFTQLRSASHELPSLETQSSLLLATCFQQLGELQQAIEALQVVALKEPANLGVRVQLAQTYLNAGQMTEATREYETATKHPAATAKILHMFVQLKALRLLNSNAPETAWKDLERTVVQLANQLGTTSADGGLLMADYARTAGRTRAALDVLQRTLGRFNTDFRVWAKLSEVVADTSGVAAAMTILDEAQNLTGDTADLRLARAELYLRDPARLRSLTNLESRTESWSEEDQARLLYGLIDVHDRAGDSKNVIRLYKKVASRRPNDLRLWVTLCQRGWAAGDSATAIEAANAVERLTREGDLDRQMCAAWKQLASHPSPGGLTALGERPDRADACIVVAQQREREQSPNQAGELFKRAVRMDPLDLESAKAYLVYLVGQSNEPDLTKYLVQLASDPRWAGDSFLRVVRLSISGLKNPEHSEKLIRSSRRLLERQPGGISWLADLYFTLGKTRESLEMCELAVRQASATPDDWLRYALQRAATTGPEAGATVITAAKAKLHPIAFAQLASAFTESPVGKGLTIPVTSPSENRARTEARLAILLAQSDRAAAILCLESYLKDTEMSAADIAWGRRKLAMLLTVRGEPSDRKRAYELLSQDAGQSIEDRRSTATIMASLYRYLDDADRKIVLAKAITLFQQLIENSVPVNPRDQYMLSQLYQASGQPNQAVAMIQKLLNKNPENVEYLLAALGILDEADQLDQARPFAERALAISPGDFRVIAAVARFELHQGQIDRVIELAEQYERTADPSSGEQTNKTALAASLLDQLSRLPRISKTPNAEKLISVALEKYESILHARPDLLPMMAGMLAAAERVPEAFSMIETNGRPVPIRYRAIAGVTAFRVGGVVEGMKPKLRDWLSAAIEAEPASLQLRLAEAEYLTLCNDLPAAQRAYEAVLKNDPRNLLALNNLAWILAPQPEAATRAQRLLDRAVQESGLTGELLDTRARIRIATKQYELAERDAIEALKQEKTPLRYFHLALAQHSQEPAEARNTFREAKKRGLDSEMVHPLDRGLVKTLETGP